VIQLVVKMENVSLKLKRMIPIKNEGMLRIIFVNAMAGMEEHHAVNYFIFERKKIIFFFFHFSSPLNSTDVQPCTPNPCKNEGTCEIDPENTTSFICTCDKDHTGETCGKKKIN